MEARSAILSYHKEKGLQNATEDEIYIGNGVSELISMSMQALLNNEDEILIPSPDYPLWTAAAKLAGEPLRRLRLAAGAALGGLYAAAIFFPGMGFLTHPLCKLGAVSYTHLLQKHPGGGDDIPSLGTEEAGGVDVLLHLGHIGAGQGLQGGEPGEEGGRD